MLLSHTITERTNMYHILQKIDTDYFCVSKVRKPIATFDEAVARVKALKVLDEGEGDNITYIITQKVGNE
tara:strand:+ start:59 stop:268 length:210 start_codon:yes stop_codon:yes gene_type:complete